MMTFLKNFLQGEKSPEEQAMLAAAQKERDVITLEADAKDEAEEECAPQGCCGGGCRG